MQEVFSRSIDFSAGLTGSLFVGDTSAHTGAFQAFIVNSDCVISIILDKDGNSLKPALGLSSNPILKQGTLITIAKGQYISSITLTSGSVVLYGV